MTSLCIYHPQSVSLSPLYTFIVRESLYLQRAQNVLYICTCSTILALSCTTRRITPFYFVITTLCTLIYCSMLDGGFFFVKLQTAFSVLLPGEVGFIKKLVNFHLSTVCVFSSTPYQKFRVVTRESALSH